MAVRIRPRGDYEQVSTSPQYPEAREDVMRRDESMWRVWAILMTSVLGVILFFSIFGFAAYMSDDDDDNGGSRPCCHITRTYDITFDALNNAYPGVILQNYTQREMLVGVNFISSRCVNFAGGLGDLYVGQAPGNNPLLFFNAFIEVEAVNLITLASTPQDDIFVFTSANIPNYLSWFPFSSTTPMYLVNNVPSDTYTNGTFSIEIITLPY